MSKIDQKWLDSFIDNDIAKGFDSYEPYTESDDGVYTHMGQPERVTEIGYVCVHCEELTTDTCCGADDNEMAYETEYGDIILQSNLEDNHIVE